jgi:chromosome segregation ATPase
MLERSITEKTQEITNMEQQMHADSDEIRRLKCKIEDQKCLHDMLRKKISEARRVERPNIPSLCKQLESLKKKERAAKDKLKSVTFEEGYIPQFIAERQDAMNSAPSEAELAALRQDLAAVKAKAIAEHHLSRAKIKITVAEELSFLRAREKELNESWRDVHGQNVDLQARIVQLRRTLNAQKLTVPEVLAIPIGVTR